MTNILERYLRLSLLAVIPFCLSAATEPTSLDNSEVILIGEQRNAMPVPGGVLFDIYVESSLKGKVLPGSIIAAKLELEENGGEDIPSLSRPNRRLWFLHQNAAVFTLRPVLRLLQSEYSVALPNGPVEAAADRVSEVPQPEFSIVDALARSVQLKDGRQNGSLAAVEILRTSNPKLQTRFIDDLSQDTSPCVQAAVVALQLLSTKWDVIDQLGRNAQEFSRCSAISIIVPTIADVRSTDPRVVHDLGILAESRICTWRPDFR